MRRSFLCISTLHRSFIYESISYSVVHTLLSQMLNLLSYGKTYLLSQKVRAKLTFSAKTYTLATKLHILSHSKTYFLTAKTYFLAADLTALDGNTYVHNKTYSLMSKPILSRQDLRLAMMAIKEHDACELIGSV